MMINKKDLMKKIKKNRILVLVVSVIVISIAYHGVQKVIDAYYFNTDIVYSKDEVVDVFEGDVTSAEEKNWFEKLFGGGEDLEEEACEGEAEGVTSGQIAEDELDLELEGTENSEDEEGIVDAVEGMIGDASGIEDGEDKAEASELQEKIYVYITGEVNVPGVVILNKGSRIVDAINAAGGTTVKANVTKVNLVYVLEDGMKVNIPNSNDLKNNPDFEYITMNSGDGADDAGSSGGSDGNSSSSNSSSVSNYSVVNINTATQTELESLPGIGPSLALKIINYRKENGKFSSIEEIKNVSGIGDSKFESLKRYITV